MATKWILNIWMTGWWFGCHVLFSHILGIIIPIDFHIFQRGDPTTNQMNISEHPLSSHDFGLDDGHGAKNGHGAPHIAPHVDSWNTSA